MADTMVLSSPISSVPTTFSSASVPATASFNSKDRPLFSRVSSPRHSTTIFAIPSTPVPSSFSSSFTTHSEPDVSENLSSNSRSTTDPSTIMFDALMNLSHPSTREQALKMLQNATSRRDDLVHEQELAHARYQAARNKARLRSVQAMNAKKALQAADFYVSRVRLAIGNSKHKEVLSHAERCSNTVVESDFDTPDDTIALLLD